MAGSKSDQGALMAGMYGIINGLMCAPIAISFCSIIFRDPAFAAYMPQLVKLVLFSCAVHQLVFLALSSLPFAIGQVQDAGLIFLSGIASTIVRGCQSSGHIESILSTTLVTLAISTAMVGLLLVITAKLKLATLIQYLPVPVIGGYLAFIGFFCGEAGLAMMANLHIVNKSDWILLFHAEAVMLYAPGLICGIAMFALLRSVRGPFVLPLCMATILAVFYLTMVATGTSFEEMRRSGWIAPMTPSMSPAESWKLYDLQNVQWNLLPDQLIPVLGMFLVVAFSSSLDIAAIEMELGLPLDYNRELNTVGYANVFSGLLGGYTGSYIFSQTIFSLRRGVFHRICGLAVVFLELVVVVLPFSLTSYVPKMFFGSLLILIAADLMFEWLYAARTKMMPYEYLVCLLTFVLIQCVGIQLGMLLGVLVASLVFVYIYSSLTSISPATLRISSVLRTMHDCSQLMGKNGKIVTISLQGYLFFGSAVRVLKEITSRMELRSERVHDAHASWSPSSHRSSLLAEDVFPAKVHRPRSYSSEASSGMPPASPSPLLPHRGLGSFSHDSPGEAAHPSPHSKSSGATGMPALVFHQVPSFRRSRGDSHASCPTRRGDVSEGRGGPEHTSPADEHTALLAGESGPNRRSYGTDVYSMSPQEIVQRCEVHPDHKIIWHSVGGLSPVTSTHRKGPRGLGVSSSTHTSAMASLEEGHGRLREKSSRPRCPSSPPPGDMVHRYSPISNFHSPSENAHTAVLTPFSHFCRNPDTSLEGVPLVRTPESASPSPPLPPPSSTVHNTLEMSQLSGWTRNTDSSPSFPLLSLAPIGARSTSWRREDERGEGLHRLEEAYVPLAPMLFDVRTRSSTSLLPQDQERRTSGGSGESVFSPTDYLGGETAVEVASIATSFLVLDFSRVLGIDATAARSCFRSLVSIANEAAVTLVFAQMPGEVEALLRAHGVLVDDSVVIDRVDDALEWCEDQVLEKDPMDYRVVHTERQHAVAHGNPAESFSSSSSSSLALKDGLQATAQLLCSAKELRNILIDFIFPDRDHNAQIARLLDSEVLVAYFEREHFDAQKRIYSVHDQADKVYFVESGTVEIIALSPRQADDTERKGGEKSEDKEQGSALAVRVNKVCAGGAFGEADFILDVRRSTSAVSTCKVVCWTIKRSVLTKMEVRHPQLCMLLQNAMLKSLALASTWANLALHPTLACNVESSTRSVLQK